MSEAACERAKELAGGPSALAKALRNVSPQPVSSQAVSQWKRVPAERVIDVERVTGVPRQDLRPDLYPPESASRPASPEAA